MWTPDLRPERPDLCRVIELKKYQTTSEAAVGGVPIYEGDSFKII